MSNYSESLGIIASFARGDLAPFDFAELLYRTPDMERMFSEEDAPRYCHAGVTLFHHLISLDFCDPGHVIDAQNLIANFLKKNGIDETPSGAQANDFRLLLSAQPKWLNADAKFLSNLLASIPPLPQKERKAMLRQKILELFRYAKRPPRWLQSPVWPMSDKGPMVFLGQMSVEDYFHDTAAAYVFHDPATGECKTIVQVA